MPCKKSFGHSHGTLNLSANSSSVYIANGLTATGLNGSGPGTINLTAISDSIYFEGNQSFDNATINLGSASGYNDTIGNDDVNNSGSVLTLGPNIIVNVNTNNYAYLGSTGSNHAGDGIINQGTINVTGVRKRACIFGGGANSMTDQLLFPRLNDIGVRQLLPADGKIDTSILDLQIESAPPFISWAATGGRRIKTNELLAIRNSVLKIAAPLGFP
jgi:hypothetical protein